MNSKSNQSQMILTIRVAMFDTTNKRNTIFCKLIFSGSFLHWAQQFLMFSVNGLVLKQVDML